MQTLDMEIKRVCSGRVNIVGGEREPWRCSSPMLRRFPRAPEGDGPDLMGPFTFEAGQVGGSCAASCGSSQHTHFLLVRVCPPSADRAPGIRLVLRRNEPVLWQQGAAESRGEPAGHVTRRFHLLDGEEREGKIKRERRERDGSEGRGGERGWGEEGWGGGGTGISADSGC